MCFGITNDAGEVKARWVFCQFGAQIKQNGLMSEENNQKENEKLIKNLMRSAKDVQGNYFRVDEYELEIILDKDKYPCSAWSIEPYNGNLSCQIVGQAKDAEALKEHKIITDYNDEGVLSFKFDCKNLYRAGKPHAELSVEEDKIQTAYYASFRTDGDYYDLIFDGKIFVDEHGVKIYGLLHDGWTDSRKYPVQIQVAFDLKDLNWDDYVFTTPEELDRCPSELVKKINFEEGVPALSEDLLRFNHLKELTVGYRYTQFQKNSLSLLEIPDWISHFTELESICISSNTLTQIPESIGKLTSLKRLTLFNAKLKPLPENIFQLPRLESIFISDCSLESIPEAVHLPELNYLDLSSNLLKRLPDSFAEQPKLKRVILSKNPWEYLPEKIGRIKNLELESKNKLKFFDFSYKGADGKGTVVWDDEIFQARHDAALMKSINAYWKNKEIKPYRAALSKLLKKSVGFALGDEDRYQTIGEHRIGGMPDLPHTVPYPTFYRDEGKTYNYEFIAQINCGAIAPLQNYLPRTGVLYFFLSTVHELYDEENAGKVIYFDGEMSSLQSGKRFNFTQKDYFETLQDIPYRGYTAQAYPFVDLPDFYAIDQNQYLLEGLSKKFIEKLEEDRDCKLNELFEPFKKSDVSVNSYGFSQHEYPEHEVSLKHKGRPQDWVILLKVPSAKDFQWGDAGDLFFVIHKSDLAKRDFSKVYCTLYSS